MEPNEITIRFIDGPMKDIAANITLPENAKAWTVITVDTSRGRFQYQLLDGPALQYLLRYKYAHPNLCVAARYIPSIDVLVKKDTTLGDSCPMN